MTKAKMRRKLDPKSLNPHTPIYGKRKPTAKVDEEGIILDLTPEIAAKNNMLSDYFYLEDLKDRVLSLDDQIDEPLAREIIRCIFKYNARDEELGIEKEARKPIYLYISSPGGDLVSTLAIIDAIEQSVTPVYTINLLEACSGAFLIFIAGDVRISMPRATFLLHEGIRAVGDSTSKAIDQQKYMQKLETEVEKLIIAHSKLSREQYVSRFREEWYMLPKEAKANGFCDFIVGEKGCSIQMVI